jgi:UDP-N-acetylglucosamine transferase subunit ALG13
VTAAPEPLLLVTVGTDHHPFDRLIGWVEAWLVGRRRGVRCQMQTGTSTPPRSSLAQWDAYLSYEALGDAMTEAAAVVCHGGPGTILGVRQAGAVPIVVPRQHRLGEHVDDHQVAFARRLAAEGTVVLAESEVDLHRLLNQVAADPAAFRAPFQSRGTAEAVRAFGQIVGDLLGDGQPDRPRSVPR